MNQNIIQLAYELCQIPSISNDEHRACAFLEKWLTHAGLMVERIPVPQSDRYNIFAYAKPQKKYSVLFCTHIDTVAPFIPPRLDEKNNILWGRGSCDAKGILSAMIYALLEQRDGGFDDLALLVTVGEEEASDGAKAADQALRDRAFFVVVGEPTELRAASAQKGNWVFDLSVEGRSAHSSMPHLGHSALHQLIGDCHKLLSREWPTDDSYGATFLNLGEFHGGEARNALARHASVKGIMRLAKASSDIIPLVKSALCPSTRLDTKSISEPFTYVLPEGYPSFVAGFGSDAPYLKAIGRPLLLGPGSLELAHKEEECIKYDDIFSGYLLYIKIAILLREKI